MKTKSLNSLSLKTKMISNLSGLKIVGGGTSDSSGCSIQETCEPTTDVGGGASCKCNED